jgi:hypothetical protein
MSAQACGFNRWMQRICPGQRVRPASDFLCGGSDPGAVHAFTNPEATEKGRQFNLPLAYHPEADKLSKAEASKSFSSVFVKWRAPGPAG